MKYRVQVDAWITDDADLHTVKAILNKLKMRLTNMTNLDGIVNRAYISYHKCRHDEGLSCEPKETVWELKGKGML